MTTSNRIQVLLRPDVHAVVLEFAHQSRLTLSKACALLVEEALEARELYDKKNYRPQGMSDYLAKATSDKDLSTTVVAKKTTPSTSDLDLELLAKLKKLQALEQAGLI